MFYASDLLHPAHIMSNVQVLLHGRNMGIICLKDPVFMHIQDVESAFTSYTMCQSYACLSCCVCLSHFAPCGADCLCFEPQRVVIYMIPWRPDRQERMHGAESADSSMDIY